VRRALFSSGQKASVGRGEKCPLQEILIHYPYVSKGSGTV